jgi:hypothetical protein
MAQLSFQGQGKVFTGSVSLNLPSIAVGAVGEGSVAIADAAVGDIVLLCGPTAGLTAGMALCTVKVRAVNGSGGTVDEAAATVFYILIRA